MEAGKDELGLVVCRETDAAFRGLGLGVCYLNVQHR